MAELDGKWEGAKEGNNPRWVMGVPHLNRYLETLVILNRDELPTQRNLRLHRQAATYTMGYADGFSFGSVLW